MNTATTELALLERSKGGDHAAFAELIKRSSPMARRAIRAIASDPADVDDVMQDTFVKAFQALRSFDQRSKFSTWLTRIAINNALMLLRSQKSKREISLEIYGEETEATSYQLRDNTLDPEQALMRHQLIEVIRNAVRALPRTLRGYVELHCLQELPTKEAASSLGISLGTGKSRLFRARKIMARSLTSLRSVPAEG